MRARNIKPGFFKNEDLAECSMAARLLFAGLWCMADREGRMEDRPKRIKAEILPYDNENADELLSELEATGFIVRYEAQGYKVIVIPKFLYHQRPHSNEKETELPPQGEEEHTKVESAADHGNKFGKPFTQALRPSSLNPSSLNPDSHEEEKSTLPSSLRLSEPKRAFAEPASAPTQKKPTIEQTHPRLHQVSKSFLQAQAKQHPSKIKTISEKKVRGGADTLRLLSERDGYDLDREIIPALQWAIKDEFWTYQVLSLASLRKPGRNGEMKFVNILASREKQEKQEPGRMSDDMLNMLDEWNKKHEQRRRDNGESGGNGTEHSNGDDGMGYEFQISDETGGDSPVGKDVGEIPSEIPRN